MLRQLASRVARIGSRGISTTAARLEGEAAPAGLKEFSEAWTATAPSTMAVPDVNSTFLKQAGDGQSLADGDRFPVNFYTPYGVIAESKIDQVVLPGVEGYFGVKANHVPYIAQLKPGVVELHDGTEVSKYFISGGFAFVHANSVTDICAVEAATLDTFDPAAVKQALQAAQNSSATEDFDVAVNRAGAELYQALDQALDAKA